MLGYYTGKKIKMNKLAYACELGIPEGYRYSSSLMLLKTRTERNDRKLTR